MLTALRNQVKHGKSILIGLAALLFVLIGLGIYWSSEPAPFDAKEAARQHAELNNETFVVGYTTAHTLFTVVDTLLTKPGGYLSNDVTPPSWWLDNMPAWEKGVVFQSRDLARAMRKDFSRSQSQSAENQYLVKTEPNLHFDHDSWMFPATEDQYREALDNLELYRASLADTQDQNAQFYARADNLARYLQEVENRLGSLSQRLSESVGQQRINTDLAGEASAQQSTPNLADQFTRTPWLKIDDVFYEARGTTWALLHFLKAIETDFESVLRNKNALISLRQIIRDLEETQNTVWSPVILNGSGFGLFANHSLVMANYISRANAAIIDLRELLENG